MKNRIAVLISTALLASLALTGCTTTPTNPTQPTLTPAELETAVSTAVMVGVVADPNATPDLLVARDLICKEASGATFTPAQINADIAAAGLTNNTAKLAIVGSLGAYQIIYAVIGATNQAAMQPYAASVCAGFTDALPPANTAAVRAKLLHRK